MGLQTDCGITEKLPSQMTALESSLTSSSDSSVHSVYQYWIYCFHNSKSGVGLASDMAWPRCSKPVIRNLSLPGLTPLPPSVCAFFCPPLLSSGQDGSSRRTFFPLRKGLFLIIVSKVWGWFLWGSHRSLAGPQAITPWQGVEFADHPWLGPGSHLFLGVVSAPQEAWGLTVEEASTSKENKNISAKMRRNDFWHSETDDTQKK